MEESKVKDKELIEVISKETEPLFKEQFINGALTGWNACLMVIKKEISSMTSSKKIKEYIDKKIEESKNRKYLEKNNDQ